MMEGNSICPCFEKGEDGTKQHSPELSEITFEQLEDWRTVRPCKNHEKNYINSRWFKEKK
jgi:hypothetical protein